MPLLRLGVRARVQTSFAAGGLLVSVFLAVASWNLTTTYLYNQREITATRSALIGAELLGRRLGASQQPTRAALQQAMGVGNTALYIPASLRGGVTASPTVEPEDIPPALLGLAARGTPAQQRIVVGGQNVLAIAMPLTGNGGVYVELFPLRVLDRTLRGLSLVLAGTTALAASLAAALGRWAAQRTLRPLRTLVDAAQEVARGKLDVRLDPAGDPDLAPLADAFNATTAALGERVERDARFASDVSHELRSPVTTMVNAAELLQNRRDELSPTNQEALDLLHAEVSRFRQLVEDLLVVSRDDQHRDLHLVPLRVAELVRRTADACAGRPVTIVAPAAAEALVDGDARRIERIVGNLVDNAGLHGGGVRDVQVTCDGLLVRIAVRDHGQGVPAADREHLVERFFRGAAARARVPGSGLGLAIVNQHVLAHGGRLRVEDLEPHGAAFIVELPIAKDES